MATLELPQLYRCTNRKCRAEYVVERNRCGACNEEIEDDYDYCEFHAYLGNDPPRPRREDSCQVCRNHVEEGTEYCREHNDQFRDEQEEFLKRCHEDCRRYRKGEEP